MQKTDLIIPFLAQIDILKSVIPLYYSSNIQDHHLKVSKEHDGTGYSTFYQGDYKLDNIKFNQQIPLFETEKKLVAYLDGIISFNIQYQIGKYKCMQKKHYWYDKHNSYDSDPNYRLACIKSDTFEITQIPETLKLHILIITPSQKFEDILKRINLYRALMNVEKLILVHSCEFSEIEATLLENENLLLLKLGKKFDAWCMEKLAETYKPTQSRLEF